MLVMKIPICLYLSAFILFHLNAIEPVAHCCCIGYVPILLHNEDKHCAQHGPDPATAAGAGWERELLTEVFYFLFDYCDILFEIESLDRGYIANNLTCTVVFFPKNLEIHLRSPSV